MSPQFGVLGVLDPPSRQEPTHFSRDIRAEPGPGNVRVTNIEPGIVRTQLADHVTDPGAREWIRGTVEAGVSISDAELAEVLAFAVALPRHVNLPQIVAVPTTQV